MLIESPSGFAAVARSEIEFLTTVSAGPAKHGVPESGADALSAIGFVGDEVFEVGVFPDDGAHDDGKSGDADNLAVVMIGAFYGVVDSKKHVVRRGTNKLGEPRFWNVAAIFAAARKLNEKLPDAGGGGWGECGESGYFHVSPLVIMIL